MVSYQRAKWSDFAPDQGETFKPWPLNSNYMVSDQGRIVSLMRKYPRLMKPALNRKFNASISMWHDGSDHSYSVHKIVMETFVGPRPSGQEICHNDGDFRNNSLSNLRYDTAKNNSKDKKLHGTTPLGENHQYALVTNEQAKEIRVKYLSGKYLQKDLAKIYGINTRTVGTIVHNKSYVDPTYTWATTKGQTYSKNFKDSGWF